MTLVWIVVVALALWFGFELGRKWDAGGREVEHEADVAEGTRGGIRLNSIVMRR